MIYSIFKIVVFKFFGAASSFLITFLISKNYAVNDAGLFFLYISNIFLFNFVFSFGLQSFFVKLMSSNNFTDHNVSFIFFKFINLSSLIFVFSILIVYILLYLNVSFYVEYTLITIFSVFFFSILEINCSLLNGSQNNTASVFFNNIFIPLIFFVGFVIFNFIGVDYVEVDNFLLYLYCTSIFLSLVFSFLFLHTKNLIFYDCYTFFEFRNILIKYPETIRFFIISCCTSLVQWSTNLFITLFIDVNSVSYFTVALKISLLLNLLLVSSNIVIGPIISRLHSDKKFDELNRVCKIIGIILFLLSTPFLIFILFFSKEIMLYFGPSYHMYFYLLQILTVGQFFNVVCGPVGYLLNMTNNESDMMSIILFTCVYSILTCVLLTLHFGVVGSAISYGSTIILQNILCLFFVKKRLGFNNLNIFRVIK